MIRPLSPFRRFAALAAALVVVSSAALAVAADKTNTSLDWVPADASFYSSSLRLKEQIDLVAESNAWAQLNALPGVQMLKMMANAELRKPNGALTLLDAFMADPQNRELVQLFKDMGSSEMVVYGDQSVVGFLELFQKVQQLNSYSSISTAIRGEQPDRMTMARVYLDFLAENLELLRAPNVVFAFKLSDEKRAVAQLNRLEDIVKNFILPQSPLPPGSFSRVYAGSAECLTLTLESQLIPWDQLPIQIFEDKPGKYAKLVEKLRGMTLAITLGVRDGYLLLSFGPSNDYLAQLGSGPKLVDLPALEPLRGRLKERLTGVGYVSKEMNDRMVMSKDDVDAMAKMALQLLPEATPDATLRKRLADDVTKLSADVKKNLPEVGASLAFSFLTPRGYEMYTYDGTENMELDGSKPLTLLQHVGGSPLIAMVMRTKYEPDQYDMAIGWLKTAHSYFEEIGVPKLPEKERQIYQEVFGKVQPLLARLNSATREFLMPALKDGQMGFVLDSKIKSAKWLGKAPPQGVELPMFEPAIVVSVSDQESLKKAMSEYKGIILDGLKLVPRDKDNKEVLANLEKYLNAIESKQVGSGTMYSIQIPSELQLDAQIAPNGAVSSDVAVFSVGSSHSERLLAVSLPPSVGMLTDPNRPLAGAFYIQAPAILDSLQPWIDMSVRYGMNDGPDDSAQSQMILSQVHTGLESLKALREITGVMYFENKQLVTHVEVHIEDVK